MDIGNSQRWNHGRRVCTESHGAHNRIFTKENQETDPFMTSTAAGQAPAPISTRRPVARENVRKRSTIPMPTFARRPTTMNSLVLVDIPQSSMVGQQRQQISDSIIIFVLEDQVQKPGNYLFWFFLGGNFDDQRSGDGRFNGWILNPRDQLRPIISRFLKCWTQRLLLLCTRSSRNPTSRRKSVSRNRKPSWRTGFYEEDRSPSWSMLDFADFFSSTLLNDIAQEFDTRWGENLWSMTRTPPDYVLESLYK